MDIFWSLLKDGGIAVAIVSVVYLFLKDRKEWTTEVSNTLHVIVATHSDSLREFKNDLKDGLKEHSEAIRELRGSLDDIKDELVKR